MLKTMECSAMEAMATEQDRMEAIAMRVDMGWDGTIMR